MREYFEAEMRLLREAAQEFAEHYPAQAGMLNLQSMHDRDPYIERLLEGVAFLTAQIRQKIDDDIPEISESLLLQLWPHLLRPFPSMTIIEFTARLGQLQQTYVIAKGTVVQSQQQACRFRTTSPIKLQPLSINKINISEASTGGNLIKLNFQLDAGVTIESLDLPDICLYLHADPALALMLHFALIGQTRQVKITFPEYSTRPAVVMGGQECIQPCHLNVQDCLSPKAGRSFYGFHLLHEYFLCREKYFFVAIQNLTNIDWPEQCREFAVEIHTNILLQDYQINKENFRLHCAPAINLFAKTSEPIKLTHRRYEYPIMVDTDNVLYSVDAVQSINEETGERYNYYPLHAFKHKNTTKRFYQVSRRNNNTYLGINSRENFTPEHLSCAVTVCNGHYPREHLQENQITIPIAGFPQHIQFKNITRPTPMYLPPPRANYRWSLISHLSLHYNSLTDLATLQELLHTYDWTSLAENQKRIAGIHAIEVQTISKIYKGALTQGLKFTLKIHEDAFSSLADIHLFGLVLHHFFSMYAHINFFVITRIICHPSNKELIWQPLLGVNSPI